MFNRVLEGKHATLGPNHEFTLRSMGDYARLLEKQGKVAEAAEVMADVVARREVVLGADHRLTKESRRALSSLVG